MTLSEKERQRFNVLNRENLDFIRGRYNKVNRWVIADMVRRSAYRYPDRPALIYNDLTLTYAQLEEACNRFANGLLDLGIKKYDRVAILAHNTVHHVIAWLGTIKAGGVYLAINYLLQGKDIAYCINHSESKVFIVEDALYGLVGDVLSDMPTVKTFIWSDQGKGESAPEDFVGFDAWCNKYPADEPDVELNIEDPVQLAYTSGTETLPKGVLLNNQSLLAEYTSAIIDGRYDSEDINLNALPIYHAAQRDVFLNPGLMMGMTNVLQLQAAPGEILENIEKYKVTMFFAAPTVWIGLLRHPDFDKYDLSSLVKGYYGASTMPVEVLKELQRRLPNCQSFYNIYGQTELSPSHTILKTEYSLEKPASVGQGELNMETRIEDDDGNPITEAGVPGEICGRGPHAMMFYYKDPDKTDETLVNGWLHSGDIGILDEDNFVTVVDRKKDMVLTGGENVPSREVEEVIYLDTRVSEVAVVGLPHERWVEGVTAFVVIKPGEEIKEEEIVELCSEHLARFKVPKGVIFVEEIPKSPSGKILKRNLREEFNDFFDR
ncbi:MAG TPA: fatty acyl-CoA synthetase [Clostridia bacterium]|nr:fatty acyl-CoA synthetase [Clostridia bacterium]